MKPRKAYREYIESFFLGFVVFCTATNPEPVTLRDVVKECGISQGGMYNYFTSIDEIVVEILNRAYGEFQIADSANEIFESNKSSVFPGIN